MLHDCTFALVHVNAIYRPTANVSLIMCTCTRVHGRGPNLHGCMPTTISSLAGPRATIGRQLDTPPRSSPPINTLGSHAQLRITLAASFPQL